MMFSDRRAITFYTAKTTEINKKYIYEIKKEMKKIERVKQRKTIYCTLVFFA